MFLIPSIGNDPEIFVMKDGFIYPSEKLSRDFTQQDIDVKAKLVVDNAAVEAQMNAGTCLSSRNSALTSCLGLLWDTLKKKFKDVADVSSLISVNAVEQVNPTDLKVLRSLRQFGCSPSLIIKNGEIEISRPEIDATKIPWRSIGFHVHLGQSEANENLSEFNTKKYLKDTSFLFRLVQMCDLIVGIPGVLLERNTEAVKIRRRILGYGKAGEFREQPHGFEYRTIGPWPLLHPMWTWFVNCLTRDAFLLTARHYDKVILPLFDRQEVEDTINNNDLVKAVKIWNNLKSLGVKHLSETPGNTIFLNQTPIKEFESILIAGGLNAITPAFSFSSWGIKDFKNETEEKAFRKYYRQIYFSGFGFKTHYDKLLGVNDNLHKALGLISNDITTDNISKSLLG